MDSEQTDNHGAADPSSTVLVTGGAGGLGVHIVDVLSNSGWQVVAFDRHSPRDQRRDSLVDDDGSVQWITSPRGDSSLAELVEDCRLVVHAAGVASLSATDDELFETNRDLTRRLFLAACESEVTQFVHISCASIYQAEQGVLTEDSPTEAYNAFEQSKLAAERVVKTLGNSRDDAPALTILRLGLLYGPGCTTMGSGMITLPAILRGYSRYLPGVSGGPRTNWCHVRDAARAVDTVLDEPEAHDETFNAADETALSFGEVLNSIIEGYDIDLGPSVRIPSLALWALLSPILDNDWAFEKARSLLRNAWQSVQRDHDLDSPLTPRLDRDALFYVRDDAIVVADKLKSLGWTPRCTDYREGIVDTIRWYQRDGWAPRYNLEGLVDRTDPSPTAQLDYQERLVGQIETADGPRDMELHLQISWPSVPWPPSGAEGLVQGEVTIDGVAEDSPVRGTIDLRWMPVLKMEYQFGFRDSDDHACRFTGIRKFEPGSPVASLSRLRGTFVDRFGDTIGDAQARYTDGPLSALASDSPS